MQITDQIHAIKVPFQITDRKGLKLQRFVYVYLILGERITLIDSAVASSEKIIFDYIREIGRGPEEISRLILTHAHPDHIGSAKAIEEATGCEVLAHSADRAWIEDVGLQSRERPVPGFHTLVGGSVKVDRPIEDGDTLELGKGLTLKVIHTPGHSKGSICLWLMEEGALFCGDAIPLAKDLPIYDDPAASAKSIKKLATIDGIKHLLAAWDQPRVGGEAYEIMNEGMQYLQRIHEAVVKATRGRPPRDSMELCELVLKELGMPDSMANPMIARSFEADMKAIEAQDPRGPDHNMLRN